MSPEILLFLFRNTIWSTTEDDKRLRNLFTIVPAVEKIRSDGTDVPGIARYFLLGQRDLVIAINFPPTISKDLHAGFPSDSSI